MDSAAKAADYRFVTYSTSTYIVLYCVIVSVCSIVNIPGMAEMMDYIVSMVPRLIAGLMYPCSLQINAKAE